jgi:hypothetical protein
MKALKNWRQPDFVCIWVWNELQGLARPPAGPRWTPLTFHCVSICETPMAKGLGQDFGLQVLNSEGLGTTSQSPTALAAWQCGAAPSDLLMPDARAKRARPYCIANCMDDISMGAGNGCPPSTPYLWPITCLL